MSEDMKKDCCGCCHDEHNSDCCNHDHEDHDCGCGHHEHECCGHDHEHECCGHHDSEHECCGNHEHDHECCGNHGDDCCCDHEDHEECGSCCDGCHGCGSQEAEDPSATCNHDCSSCQANCSSRVEKFTLNPLSSVKRVIGIVSGKGGVGKSLVTSLLASSVNKQGLRAAVLDADITGPSMAKVFGIDDHAMGGNDGIYPAISACGIQVISTNMLLESEDTPVIWRGPVLAGLVKQFYSDVIWEDVDYMFVDMPPGTGDVPLTVFQSIPLDGIVIVTTPQDLVSMVVMKAVNMANAMNIPILGLVENMAYFDCDDCGCRNYPFGKGDVKGLAQSLDIPSSLELPINPDFSKLSDLGRVEFVDNQDVDDFAQELMQHLEDGNN